MILTSLYHSVLYRIAMTAKYLSGAIMNACMLYLNILTLLGNS